MYGRSPESASNPDQSESFDYSQSIPAPPRKARRFPKVLVAIATVVASFAAGVFAGSYLLDLGDDGGGNDTSVDDGAVGSPDADVTTADGGAQAGGDQQVAGPFFNPFGADDYGSGDCAPPEGVAVPVLDFDNAPALCIDPAASYTAVFDTSVGTVRVALDAANTPGTVNNFVNLARFGYYNDTLLHRTDPSIGIIQGGSPHTDDASDPGPGYTIWDEGSGFTYGPGLLVMARGAGPNSADAQFFFTVNQAASGILGDGTSVVFGSVVEGSDVLAAILARHIDIDQPDSGLSGGAPIPPVTINTITIQT